MKKKDVASAADKVGTVGDVLTLNPTTTPVGIGVKGAQYLTKAVLWTANKLKDIAVGREAYTDRLVDMQPISTTEIESDEYFINYLNNANISSARMLNNSRELRQTLAKLRGAMMERGSENRDMQYQSAKNQLESLYGNMKLYSQNLENLAKNIENNDSINVYVTKEQIEEYKKNLIEKGEIPKEYQDMLKNMGLTDEEIEGIVEETDLSARGELEDKINLSEALRQLATGIKELELEDELPQFFLDVSLEKEEKRYYELNKCLSNSKYCSTNDEATRLQILNKCKALSSAKLKKQKNSRPTYQYIYPYYYWYPYGYYAPLNRR